MGSREQHLLPISDVSVTALKTICPNTCQPPLSFHLSLELPGEEVSFCAQLSPKQGLMGNLSSKHGIRAPKSFTQLMNTDQAPLKNCVSSRLVVVESGETPPCSEPGDNPTSMGFFSSPCSPPKGASADVPVQQLPKGFLLQLAPAHSHLHPQLLQHLCHVSAWEGRVQQDELLSLQPGAGPRYCCEALGQWVWPLLSIWDQCPKNGHGEGCSRDIQTGCLAPGLCSK